MFDPLLTKLNSFQWSRRSLLLQRDRGAGPLSPFQGCAISLPVAHGLRRGLYSCAASRLPNLLACPLDALQIHAFFRHFVQRREFAQPFDRFDNTVGHVIDFSLGIEAANAEANRAVGEVIARAQSFQYI